MPVTLLVLMMVVQASGLAQLSKRINKLIPSTESDHNPRNRGITRNLPCQHGRECTSRRRADTHSPHQLVSDGRHNTQNKFRLLSQSVASESLEEGVLVFVPGVVKDRVPIVQSHLEWLQQQEIPFECVVYSYDIAVMTGFYPCKVIKHTGYWMDHIKAVPLNETKKKHVLHIMDGIKVEHVNLTRMMQAIEDNNLIHAAPALVGKNHYPCMVPELGFGHLVSFIEYHFDIFTRDNFACLQDLLDIATNHLGWGVDFMVPQNCPGRMGVIDVMRVRKVAAGAYDGGRAHEEMTTFAKTLAAAGCSPGGSCRNSSIGFLHGEILPGDPQCDGLKSPELCTA